MTDSVIDIQSRWYDGWENARRWHELRVGRYEGLLDPEVFERRMEARRALRGYRTHLEYLVDIVGFVVCAALVIVIAFAVAWGVS